MSKQFKLKFAAVLGVAVLVAACAAWAVTEAPKSAEENKVASRAVRSRRRTSMRSFSPWAPRA